LRGTSQTSLAHLVLLPFAMKRERQVNRERVEHQPPEPQEQTSYKEATTVTDDERPPLHGPPQETGTTEPRD
jgi:hypothetical protein